MTQLCKICDLHPFLENWVEGLIASSLSLRQVAGKMREHGIDVSYQGVNRHKKHMSRSEKIKRLRLDLERLRKRSPSMQVTLNRLKNQRAQMRSWIEAEPSPSREALDVLHDLDQKIDQLTLTIQMTQSLKLYRDLLH